MVRATGRSADLVVGGNDEEEGDVFVELDGFVAVEMVTLCFFLLYAKVVEKRVDGR